MVTACTASFHYPHLSSSIFGMTRTARCDGRAYYNPCHIEALVRWPQKDMGNDKIIVRAGVVWSGVGTLAVALRGAPLPCHFAQACGLPVPITRGRPAGVAAPCLSIKAISAVLLILPSPCTLKLWH